MYMFRLHINLVIIKVSIAALTDGENYPSPPEFKNKSKFVKKKNKIKKNRTKSPPTEILFL